MTGIAACLTAAAPNAIYAAGLRQQQPSVATDLSPISVGTTSSQSTAINVTYEWIGYFRPSVSGTIQLGANCPYTEYYRFNFQNFVFDWGGGGNSTCYIWTGSTAISGYNTGNATAFIQNEQNSTGFAAVVGVNYPIRIQWSTSLPRVSSSGIVYFATSSFSFLVNSDSNVSGQIFYNTLTNGF